MAETKVNNNNNSNDGSPDDDRAAAKDDLLSGVLLNHCLIYGNLGKIYYNSAVSAEALGIRFTCFCIYSYHISPTF